MSIKNIISSLDFFNTLNDEQITMLTKISSINSYTKDYVLHYEKSDSDKLLFLTEGLAKAYKIDKHENEIFLHYIYKNNMLSEISDINSNTLHSFSNIAFVEDSRVLSIDYALFKKNFLKNNILCMEFTNEIIFKSRQMQSLINREFIFDAVAKVAMMLHSDLAMFNKLKRHDISLILHIQPATLSRVLNRLKRNKIIDITQGKISILDFQNLEMLYKEG